MSVSSKRLLQTPSQTAGPYVHIGCTPKFAGLNTGKADLGSSLIKDGVKGEGIQISGSVYDGKGAPVTDAMVEIWQADYSGLFRSPLETRGEADPLFDGWGRAACDAQTGGFCFETVKPGAVIDNMGVRHAPHITFWIVARGINRGLHTRLYFPDEVEANANDSVLALITDQNSIATLIAAKVADASYRFDIHLQGENETVFFDA